MTIAGAMPTILTAKMRTAKLYLFTVMLQRPQPAKIPANDFCVSEHNLNELNWRDDLSNGESYYIVEIKALKRILDAVPNSDTPLLCFVDEVLRGTNTVERIAASAQILKCLAQKSVQCFAATHDIELTHLLEEWYSNYHFEEQIKDDDVLFNYQLKEGRATSRNAISLLKVMGYDEAIINAARARADKFTETGKY